MAWVFLSAAIIIEVGATLALRMATNGSWKWYIPVVVGYVASFILISNALAAGLGIGVAYGIWTATGVAIIAVLSKVLFKEPLTLLMSAGILLVIGGVLLIEMGH